MGQSTSSSLGGGGVGGAAANISLIDMYLA